MLGYRSRILKSHALQNSLYSNCFAQNIQLFSSESKVTPKSKDASTSPVTFSGTVKSLKELSKFRLSSLVVVTTGAGFVCTGIPIDFGLMATACFGTGLCAASASTFNQVFERTNDAAMKRTLNRPLPTGALTPFQAKAWGALTGTTGVSMLLYGTNPVVAVLGASNILLYAGAYTFSKRFTEYNTWIGSFVGAIPPVMGWAAASGGSIFTYEPIALGTLLFLWQFPHFFALSWLHREDYARGNFQMVAVNDPDGKRSSRLIMEYSLYLAAFPLVTSGMGLTSYMFALEGTVVNAYFLYLAKKFNDQRNNSGARRIFLASLWYLPVLLTAYVFHSRTWDMEMETKISEFELNPYINQMKEKLRGVCIHDIIAKDKQTSTPQACLKINTNKTVDSALKGAESTVGGAVIAMNESVNTVSDAKNITNSTKSSNDKIK